LAAAALLDSVNNGRNGLGTLHMWAAGNGLQNLDNVNYDAYANSPYTIAVGAVGHNGNQAFYSEPGAAMLITAPSNGGGAGITTTDLLGSAGYDAGDCTNGFGGTSSSTPLAAGVVALMLQANPNLTWRDVQHILVETAVRNDPTDGDWSTNGANRLINHKYGFGRIDAQAAVGTARTWNNVAAASRFSTPVDSVNQAIPDNNPTGVSASLVVNNNLILEHVEIVFNATHPFRGDLVVTLTSPAGTESVLAERRNDNGDNYNDWRFMTVRNWGETANGTWTLQVSDAGAQDTGSFNSWQLILHGTAVATGNQIFSDQFEDS
jgi:subtilisin-like proprotein convertase family protein